jgi:hypothetical protein
MKRSQSVLMFLIAALIFPATAKGQAWSGIIAPTRAADWTKAGIPGGVPSGSWTQCGSTIAAYSGTTATINSALASCGANHFVLLGPGTFNLSGGIAFPKTGHVVLRGSGANGTFIVPSTSGANCGLGSGIICAVSSDTTYGGEPPPIMYGWTSGYASGTNQLTLSGTSGISTSTPTMLFLEQCETGLTASSPSAACTGSAVDNGQLFVCSARYNPGSPATGCSADGPGNESPLRGQVEITTATAINGNVVTIADPLRYPNWTSSQTPRVWIAQPIVQVGVENLAIDMTSAGGAIGVGFYNAYQFWVSGVKITNFSQWAIEMFQVEHGIIQNNYIDHSTGSDSYAIRFETGSGSVVQNNIITQVFLPLAFDGPSSGNVVAYNFSVNDNYQSDYMRGTFFSHDVNAVDLYEGNIALQMSNDGNHGTGNLITRFRNLFLGWDSCANGQCGSSTFKDSGTGSISDAYGSRYGNNIGNVSGTAGYHHSYVTPPGNSNTSIYGMGVGNGGVSPGVPNDPLSYPTSLFWGNYDVVTGATRWCGNSSSTSWASLCSGSSEIPTSASGYPNPMPTKGDTGAGMPGLPASFYLLGQPSWWGTMPFPAIGPDVTGGNVGVCSGTLNTSGHQSGMPATSSAQCTGTSLSTGWAGHVNAIPAMNCALNVMGMPPDGTGPALPFDATTCYGGVPSVQAPNPPTNLVVTVN